MNKNISITVDHLSKTFRLPHDKQNSLKGGLISLLKNGRRTYETQHVLKDISFEIKKGEFFGVVGRNGSGKSTLLKLLAGIYHPTNGSIEVVGSLTPFIELGVGFNPELTGRENVYLNGALLGFNNAEMQTMYNDIVEFAELKKFMDQKLKNYSSGMQVRLAFSIAIRARSDILLLDEVLAVGDVAFQKKCYDYFMNLKKQKQTVILVTHDMGAVRQYCDRAMMIERGEIVEIGKVEKVTQRYLKLFSNEASKNQDSEDDEDRWGSKKIEAVSVDVKQNTDNITINVLYKAKEIIESPIFGFNIYNSRGINILEGNTMRLEKSPGVVHERDELAIEWTFPNMLASDTYNVSVSSCDSSSSEFFDWWNNAADLKIEKTGNTAAMTDPNLQLSLKINNSEKV